MDLPDDLISTGKAAKIAGCNVATIHRWIFKGRIRAWRLAGASYRVSESEVKEQLQPTPIPNKKPRRHSQASANRCHQKAMETIRAMGVNV